MVDDLTFEELNLLSQLEQYREARFRRSKQTFLIVISVSMGIVLVGKTAEVISDEGAIGLWRDLLDSSPFLAIVCIVSMWAYHFRMVSFGKMVSKLRSSACPEAKAS